MPFVCLLSQATGLPAETMRVVLERCYNDLRLLYVPNKTLKAEGFFRSNKVFLFLFSPFCVEKASYKKEILILVFTCFLSGFCRELRVNRSSGCFH